MLRWAQIAALARGAGSERDAHAPWKEVRPRRGNFGHDCDTKAPVRTLTFKLCLVLIAALVPGRAFAQAVFAHRATMRSDGVAVAQFSRTPATLVRWVGPRRPVLRFEDAALEAEPGAGDPMWLLNVWIRGPLDIMPPPTQGARYCWPVVVAWP